MVSVLPCFWLGQCGSSRVYKRRRLSTVRSARPFSCAVRYFSVSRFLSTRLFQVRYCLRLGSSVSRVKSSVLLALPMRKSFLLYTKKVGYRIASYLIPEDSRCESQGVSVTEHDAVVSAVMEHSTSFRFRTSPDGPWPAERANRFWLFCCR